MNNSRLCSSSICKNISDPIRKLNIFGSEIDFYFIKIVFFVIIISIGFYSSLSIIREYVEAYYSRIPQVSVVSSEENSTVAKPITTVHNNISEHVVTDEQSPVIDVYGSVYNLVTPKNLQEFMELQNYKLFPELSNIIILSVFEASKKYNVPAIILLSLMAVESNFDYSCVSKVGAIGLLQISKVWLDPKWDKSLISVGLIKNKKDLYNPKLNIMCGAYILNYYITMGNNKHIENPIQFSLTKYLGGDSNSHYVNVLKILGEYHVFTMLKTMKKGGKNANA
jgi:hypothetical protein